MSKNFLADVDWQSVARLISYPGIDPRLWVSLAIVDVDTPQSRSVQFNDDQGTPLPQPLVNVTLQPSGVEVSARVLSSVSGAGVGEWHPFVGGDEVLVLVPSGDMRMGCVIIGRLSNLLDTHPATIAGNDTTQNNIAFKRFTEPYVLESGTAIMLRVAATGSFLSLDPTGNVTLQSGAGHYLALHNDQVSLMTKDTSCMLQFDPSKQTTYLQAGATQLLLDSAGKSHFLSTGQLSLVTSGGGYAPGHAVTTEQVAVILQALGANLAALGPPIAAIGAAIVAAVLSPLWAAAAAAGLSPTTTGAIIAALQAPPDPSGSKPGVGRPGLLF